MSKTGQIFVVAELLINYCNGWCIIRDNKLYFVPSEHHLDWDFTTIHFHEVVKKQCLQDGLGYKWFTDMPCPMCDEYSLPGLLVGEYGCLIIE